jgi:hypothetical protein
MTRAGAQASGASLADGHARAEAVIRRREAGCPWPADPVMTLATRCP